MSDYNELDYVITEKLRKDGSRCGFNLSWGWSSSSPRTPATLHKALRSKQPKYRGTGRARKCVLRGVKAKSVRIPDPKLRSELQGVGIVEKG